MKRLTGLALDGIEIPPKGDGPAPIVIALHGRGSNAQDLAGLAPALDPDRRWRMVFPDAPRPFEPYPGMTFGFSWFEGWPPVPGTLEESRELLIRFFGELKERFPVAEGKVALIGFSQGAMMVLDAGLRLDPSPAAIVAMSGGIEERDLPDLSSRTDQKILQVHGTADDMIPVVYARRTRRLLEDRGLSPEYHEFDMGHWVTDESIAVVKKFLDEALG